MFLPSQLNGSITSLFISLQHQVCDILTNVDFPGDCIMPQMFNYHGPDNKMDVVSCSINDLYIV